MRGLRPARHGPESGNFKALRKPYTSPLAHLRAALQEAAGRNHPYDLRAGYGGRG